MTGFLHHRLLADVAGAGLGWPSDGRLFWASDRGGLRIS
jgi:hypothetical protein